MADLVIREADGWIEISQIVSEIAPDAQRELWGYSGAGDVESAQAVLDMEAGADLENLIGTRDLEAVLVLSVPDDRRGDRLRVWIKPKS